jgi:predicted nuclease of predicted toxin-antitoxin system
MAFKIILDENLSPTWSTFLAQYGHEAVYWLCIGQAGAEDAHIMTYARENGYLVLTRDLDFGTLLAQTQVSGPSVILIREGGVLPQTLGTDVVSLLEQYETELSEGALIVLDSSRHRVRILPIGQKANKQKD